MSPSILGSLRTWGGLLWTSREASKWGPRELPYLVRQRSWPWVSQRHMRGQGQAPNLAKCQPSVPLAGSIQRSGASPGTRVQQKKIRQHRARPQWTTRKHGPNRPSLCQRPWSASRWEDRWLRWLVAFIKLIKENMNLHSPQKRKQVEYQRKEPLRWTGDKRRGPRLRTQTFKFPIRQVPPPPPQNHFWVYEFGYRKHTVL